MKRIDMLIIGGSLALLLLLVRGTISPGPYVYDEADYMHLVSLGMRANYTDAPSQSLFEFLNVGLRRGPDPAQRASMSEYIRGSNDVNFYRHWHGPLYYYWLAATARGWKSDEHAMRAFTLLFHVLTFLAIYGGCLWILPGAQGRLTASLASAMYLFSNVSIRTASEIAPHSLFVLCFVCTLLLLSKMLETADLRYWYPAVVTAALAFCTLEIAFTLVMTLIACCALGWKRLGLNWSARQWLRFGGVSLALFAIVVLAVWPGAILKLSFLKAYFFMAYLAVFRSSPWGNDGTLLQVWRARLMNSPVEFLMIGLSLAFYVVSLRRREKPEQLGRWCTAPFLIYGVLTLLATLRVNSLTPRYQSPFLAAFHLFSGFVIAAILMRFTPRVRFASAALVLALLFINSYRQMRPAVPKTACPGFAVLKKLRGYKLSNQTILVPQGDLPMIHYYMPGMRLKPYLEEAEVPDLLRKARCDGVLYTRGTIRYVALGGN
jgi:hypothetical protein